jgi:hypothetical protein
MTLPAIGSWPSREEFLADPTTSLDDMYSDLVEEIADPSWRLIGTTAVGAGLSTVAVATSIDRLPAYIFVEPSWLTTHRVISKATTGFTVDFGTAAPGGGGSVDWLVIVGEPGP